MAPSEPSADRRAANDLMEMRPTVVCLLPARNCAHDLSGFFSSARRFADAVVALDDGSIDETSERLEAEPLVKVLLRNPRRDTYTGWDDSANRNRLLKAAADLAPDWIISIDADERLAQDDAEALRELVEHEARPDFAYSLRVFRMVGDLEHFDLDRPWVARLFAYEPGQVFSGARLHFAAVPTSIPSQRRVKTTLRIQHLSGLTAERREARYKKYAEVDPKRSWQSTYDHLLSPPKGVKKWASRAPHLPLLQNGRARRGYRDARTGRPSFSILLPTSEATLLRHSSAYPGLELITPDTYGSIPGDDKPAAMFPRSRAELAGALERASGRFVCFFDPQLDLSPTSLAARVKAHEAGYALVTGVIVNSSHTPAGWAHYFLESSHALPGSPATEVRSSKLSYSYLRDAVSAEVRMWGQADEADEADIDEAVLSAHLLDRGYGAYRDPAIKLFHAGRDRGLRSLVGDRFSQGRERISATTSPPLHPLDQGGKREIRRHLSAVAPRRIARITRNVARDGAGLRLRYLAVSPLVIVGAISEWVGALYEIFRGPSSEKSNP